MSEDGRGGRHRHRAGRVAQVSVAAEPAGRRHHQRQGPWDAEDAPRDGRLRLDLGSVQLPIPRGARLKAEPDPSGPLRAVHALVPEGRLTVSAFAAPRTGGLWPELVEELAAQLQKEGATIRRDRGEWGRELVARNGNTVARVVGVEGPRWMLRGVGTGPVEHALKLHGMLREMLRGTVVARSSDPLPVRSLLPLEVPEDVPEEFADSLVESMPTKPRQITRPEGPVIPMMLPQRAGAGTSPGRT
ncbi:DUF3710 domain-containing protein [Actinomycetospora lutea]|uniref:DUF3710 domain-containing protein n=1 Tax=Actinomycetospora lutea TaxID=663604 RepID=UPI002366E81A|nr:DUF3710 domain-containing protein [Actinomycetospora lutea]MDD7936842.1 DUF3710 domain-containing protein [Actinomycetospora lutea]